MKRLIILAACLTSPLLAVETTSTMVECSKDNITRQIEVKITNNGATEACEVVYHKPSEGGQSSTIWSADQQKGYCDEKAAGFVKKQQSWGFACSGQAKLLKASDSNNSAAEDSNTATQAPNTNESNNNTMPETTTDKAKKMMNDTTKKLKDSTDTTNDAMDNGTKEIKQKMNDATKSMMDKAKAKASEATGNAVDSAKQKGSDVMNKATGN